MHGVSTQPTMISPTIIQQINQTAPGEDIQALDNLVLFRVDKHRFRYGQSYALLRGNSMVLVDAVHQATRAAVDRWREQYTPVGLVLTHSDLLSQAFAPMSKVVAWLEAPVFIHSQDRQGQAVQPIEEAQEWLAQHQLRYFHVPGHTPGSVMLYAEPERFLFTGDSAIGANYERDTLAYTHPPIGASDWKGFEQAWQQIDISVQALLPLHGKPDFALDSLENFKKSLLVPDNVMQE